jgi:antitoxin VapB
VIAQTTLLAPIAAFAECGLDDVNRLLVAWGHRMGPLDRGVTNYGCEGYYALLHHREPIAVATHSTLIRDHAGGGLAHLTRDNTIELSRLCAARPGLCRVMLRLWRELVFPALGLRYALSYQDADLHTGNTYRFDGWKRSLEMSRSGTDARTGKRGRNKWVWYWELPAVASMERAS